MPTDSTETPITRYRRLSRLIFLRRPLIPFWHFFGHDESPNSRDLFLHYLNSLIIVTTVRVILVASVWLWIYVTFSPLSRHRVLIVILAYMLLEGASFLAAVKAAKRRRFWEEET